MGQTSRPADPAPETRPSPRKDASVSPLDRRLELFEVDGNLAAALQHLGELAGVRISPDWSSLAAVGVGKDAAVTLHLVDKPVRRVLNLILARVSPTEATLTWTLDDDVVRITARAPSPDDQRDPAPRRRPARAVASLTFDDLPLVDAVETIGHAAGVPIHVSWRALGAVGVTRQTPVTLDVPDLPAARALDLILADLNTDRDKFNRVYWHVEDGLVRITTGHALNAGELTTTVFDIGDLLIVPPHFVGPRIDVAAIQNENMGNPFLAAENDQPSAAEQRRETKRIILESVQAMLDADMWDDGGGRGTARIVGTRLIVSQTRLGYLLLAAR